MKFEVDRVDGLQINTRIAMASTEEWESVPNRLSQKLVGLKGTDLLYLLKVGCRAAVLVIIVAR